jgi:hypothetical protein
MTSSRRRSVVAATCVAALLAGAWLGDAGSAIPIEWFRESGTEPLLQPPEAALRLLERRLQLMGGIPHDARLTRFAPFSYDTALAADPRRIVSVTGYNFTFEPDDTVSPNERITARVDADTLRTCLDGGALASPYGGRHSEPSCHRYRLAFPLRVASFERHWRPRALRVAMRWRDSAFAPRFAAPTSIETGCSTAAGTDSFRRVVAAGTEPLALKGRFDARALWEPSVAAVHAGHGILGTWAPPYPTIRLAQPFRGGLNEVPIRAAVVLDIPVGGRPERLVLVRTAQSPSQADDVGALEAASDEPVCSPLRVVEAETPVVGPWGWDAIVRIVRARAEDEARWIAAFRGSALDSRIVRIDRRAGDTSTVDVETGVDRSRWKGRFAVNERVPEITGAEFTKLAGTVVAAPSGPPIGRVAGP